MSNERKTLVISMWVAIAIFLGFSFVGCGGDYSVPGGQATAPPAVDNRVSPPQSSEPSTVMDLMLRYMPGTPQALADDIQLARTRPETISCPPVDRAPVVAIPWERTPTPRLAEQLPMVMVCAAAGLEGYGDLEANVKAELERRLQ